MKTLPQQRVELPNRAKENKNGDQAGLEGRKFVPEKY